MVGAKEQVNDAFNARYGADMLMKKMHKSGENPGLLRLAYGIWEKELEDGDLAKILEAQAAAETSDEKAVREAVYDPVWGDVATKVSQGVAVYEKTSRLNDVTAEIFENATLTALLSHKPYTLKRVKREVKKGDTTETEYKFEEERVVPSLSIAEIQAHFNSAYDTYLQRLIRAGEEEHRERAPAGRGPPQEPGVEEGAQQVDITPERDVVPHAETPAEQPQQKRRAQSQRQPSLEEKLKAERKSFIESLRSVACETGMTEGTLRKYKALGMSREAIKILDEPTGYGTIVRGVDGTAHAYRIKNANKERLLDLILGYDERGKFVVKEKIYKTRAQKFKERGESSFIAEGRKEYEKIKRGLGENLIPMERKDGRFDVYNDVNNYKVGIVVPMPEGFEFFPNSVKISPSKLEKLSPEDAREFIGIYPGIKWIKGAEVVPLSQRGKKILEKLDKGTYGISKKPAKKLGGTYKEYFGAILGMGGGGAAGTATALAMGMTGLIGPVVGGLAAAAGLFGGYLSGHYLARREKVYEVKPLPKPGMRDATKETLSLRNGARDKLKPPQPAPAIPVAQPVSPGKVNSAEAHSGDNGDNGGITPAPEPAKVGQPSSLAKYFMEKSEKKDVPPEILAILSQAGGSAQPAST